MSNYFSLSYQEQGPVLTQATEPTESLLIIGPALDGPTNTPIKVKSQLEAENMFGPFTFSGQYINPNTGIADGGYAFNELLRAYQEATRAGAKNIFLVRAGGKKASASQLGGVNGFDVLASDPGVQFNGMSVSHTPIGATGSIVFSQPAQYGTPTVTYTYGATTTLLELLNQINADSRVSTMRLVRRATLDPFALASSLTSGTVILLGGTYGTEAKGDDNYNGKFAYYQELLKADVGTFDMLAEKEFNLILLSGIYVDDQVVTGAAATTTSVVQDFAKFMGTVNGRNPSHGFIGVHPLNQYHENDKDLISAHILNYWEDASAGWADQALKITKLGYFRSQGVILTDPVSGKTTDYGAYVSVVAGPDLRVTSSNIGNYATNPVAFYAGQVSATASQVSMTRQTVPSTLGLRFQINSKQVRRLVNGLGWNDVTKLPGKGPLVVYNLEKDGDAPRIAYDVTFVNDTRAAFGDLQSERTAFDAIRSVRAALLPFIGQSFTTENKMAMEQVTRGALTVMAEAGKLAPGGEGISWQFSLEGTTALSIAQNEVVVQLILTTPYQIKRIAINTTVRRPS